MDLPNPKLSAWSAVMAGNGSLALLGSGPTPGPIHTILRAETFAVLWTLRAVKDVSLFVDNSTVVHGLNSILSCGFDRQAWDTKADIDLWVEIAAEIVARPAGLAKVTKVKSHVDSARLITPYDHWIKEGNDAADGYAKAALRTLQRSLIGWCPVAEGQAIDQAFLASRCLQDLSERAFRLRKDNPLPPPLETAPSQPTPGVCPVSYSSWTPQRTSPVASCTWDDRWITLVLHYFGQLKWPDEVPAADSGISLLEIMLDFCISFRVRPPINAPLSKLRLPEVPVLPVSTDVDDPVSTREPSVFGQPGFLQCCSVIKGHSDPALWFRGQAPPVSDLGSWHPRS